MTTAATAPTPTTEPSRAGRLLDLVRKLIDYGKELAATLRQHSATIDLAAATRPFGTRDIALILARITCGLHRANALEARLVRNAARLDAAPRPRAKPSVARPAAATRPPAAPPTDARLAHLPTPEQIAAEVRRRPIGAVIADICRDLGIMPSHPLWREVQMAMIRHGGSLANLVRDLIQQSFQSLVPGAESAALPAPSPLPSPAGTGPP
ncbi:MAG TPA: hypothetical protein VNW90_25070 [Acetobacteraceae bacterium]|jgi:hypothetical protein|nr:hypothetical protein [Acetobacteraceae bacterium]